MALQAASIPHPQNMLKQASYAPHAPMPPMHPCSASLTHQDGDGEDVRGIGSEPETEALVDLALHQLLLTDEF